MCDPDTFNSSVAARIVLLVEDEVLVAMLLADTMENAGTKVEVANNGTAALALIKSLPHLDAAVVNLCLGIGPDGKDVVRALRARWPSLPVIVVTGYAADIPQADLRGLGGPMIRLHKPIEMDELGSRLAALSRGGWLGWDAAKQPRRRSEGAAGASSR